MAVKFPEWFYCVKLGKYASDTCAVLSEHYGGEAMKKSRVFQWYKRFKMGPEKLRQISSLSLISRVLFSLNSLHKASQSTKLMMRKYWSCYMKLCIEKCLNFGPMIIFSTMTMPQRTRHSLSSSFCSKNRLLKC